MSLRARIRVAKLQELDPKGLFWVICEFDPRNLAGSGPFVIAGEIARQTGWKLLNIAIRPDFSRQARAFAFTDVCEYLLLFIKEPDHRFNKDIIRESHIWQHAEWGKREKNYFPLGKDPGNVWVPTIDDGKGTVTGHVPMNLISTFARCIFLAIPRENEVQDKQNVMSIRICTHRREKLEEITSKLMKHAAERQKTFEKTRASLAKDEARNALVSALHELKPLPLGEYTCLIRFDGQNFTCHRALTGETVVSIRSSPELSTLWAAATGSKEPEILVSKAFKLATAINQATKARAAIEGAWFPRGWSVEIEPL